MSCLTLGRCALSVCASAILLAACGGSQSAALSPRSMTNAITNGARPLGYGPLDASIMVQRPGAAHPDHHRSWVSPDAKRAKQILFVSDRGHDDVYMYSLPQMKLIGTLTGFSDPAYMCSDTKGNVYLANPVSAQVFRISHAGLITAKYEDLYGYPVGCGYDAATGHLAVTNVYDFSGPGQVLVFDSANPSKPPTVLSNPNQYYYNFVGYDPKSILWVSGRDVFGNYMVSSCGPSSCGNVYLYDGTLYYPGAVQWNPLSNNWVLFDQECGDEYAACSYPVLAGDILGAPTIYKNYEGGSVCDMAQGVLDSKATFVAGADYEFCANASSSFSRWPYAAGGTPTKYRTTDAYSVPVGAAISTR